MDEREFRRMLERYPVVRTRNHARVEWNSLVSGRLILSLSCAFEGRVVGLDWLT